MIKITKAGFLYIFITILVGVSAVNTANNLLYLLTSFLLGFMGISGFFGKQNLYNVEIELHLPEEIYASKDIPVTLKIKNRKRFFPSVLLRVELGDKYTLFPFLNPGEEDIKFLFLVFPRRGRQRVGKILVSSVFPFNFFRRIRIIECNDEIIVFPAIKKYDMLQYFENSMFFGSRKSAMKGFEEDIISIRDYTEKDGLKYIHWKASAKTDKLKTKEFSGTLRNSVTIDFENIPIQDLEEKISCITYTLITAIKHHIPFGLKIGGKLFPPDLSKTHKIKLLKELALYGEDKRIP